MMSKTRISTSLAALLLVPSAWAVEERISFNDQIRPILSDRCFKCHGPDAENNTSELRLDTAENAYKNLDGAIGIVPGDVENSTVHQRIHATDPNTMMPPPDSNLSLTEEEKSIIDQWITEGAEYEKHWSFISIDKEIPVPTDGDGWAVNEIDRFIARGHKEQGMEPAEDSPKEKWLRRASFDVTGLPPTEAELDAFLADDSESAYETVVDRLLQSDAYAERMTSEWLDVARYSDSYGYQRDAERFVWPWRDWVINSFRENKPYSTFITEQLAGDLIPNATQDQKLATVFNRLHAHVMEGGSILEEYRCEYVADRTETVSVSMLGLTMQCAKCHDHKYDPIPTADVYSFGSFFSNIDESGMIAYFTDAAPTPSMPLTSDEDKRELAAADQKITEALTQLKTVKDGNVESFEQWLVERPSDVDMPGQVGHYTFDEISAENTIANLSDEATPAANTPANVLVEGYKGKAIKTTGDDRLDVPVGDFVRSDSFSAAIWVKSAKQSERANIFTRGGGADDAASMGYEFLLLDGKPTASLIHFWPGNGLRIQSKEAIAAGEWTHLALTYDGSSKASGLKIYVDGSVVETEVIKDTLTHSISAYRGDHQTDRQYVALGERYRDSGFKQGLLDEFRVFDREVSAIEIAQIKDEKSLQDLLAKPLDALTEDDRKQLRDYYSLAISPEAMAATQAVEDARLAYNVRLDAVPVVSIMEEMDTERQDYVLLRGAYDSRGEEVSSDTPTALPPFPDDQPRNRLGLAAWLTSDEQPLTSRVTVNRYWQMIFGVGIVATSEDFGLQGSKPTHPELLDWLARDFMDNGWDLHRLIKQMVLSKTYRQSTETSPENRAKDPENLILARSHTTRLPAEMIRDNALAVSGLLVDKVGGPPTKPYDVSVSFIPIEHDKGENLYRRSVYHWWKRNAASPVLTAFDVPKRDICTVKREVTSSPLQSLIMLNNPQIMEAARVFAANLLDTPGVDSKDIVTRAFRALTSRLPDEEETRILMKLYSLQLADFEENPDSAAELLTIGEAPAASLPAPQQAAVTVLINAIMNLDDSLTER